MRGRPAYFREGDAVRIARQVRERERSSRGGGVPPRATTPRLAGGGAAPLDFWAISPPGGIPPRTAGTVTLEGSTITRAVHNHWYTPVPGGRLCLCGSVRGQWTVKLWDCVPAPIPEPPPPPPAPSSMAPGAYLTFLF